MKVRVKTAPAAEPVSVSTAMEVLRIDGTESDAIIGSLITAARTFAEETTGISIAEKVYEMAYDMYPPNIIKLPYPELIALNAVTVTDRNGTTTSMATASWVVDTFGSALVKKESASYPTITLQEANGFIIEYTAGYKSVPEDIKQAILLYVKAQFECIPPTDWLPSFNRLMFPYKAVGI